MDNYAVGCFDAVVDSRTIRLCGNRIRERLNAGQWDNETMSQQINPGAVVGHWNNSAVG